MNECLRRAFAVVIAEGGIDIGLVVADVGVSEACFFVN